MLFNIQKFKAVADAAKARTNDKRWQAAIDKAVAGVISGWWVITELHDGIAVTTESGKTYFANGSCQCPAFENGQACKHRALARLIDLYHEAEAVQPAASRADIIADIKSTWSRRFPGESLADELMRRFRKNQLEMLSVDFLMAVRAAIA